MATKLPALIPFAGPYGNAFLLPHGDGFIAVDVGTPDIALRMVRYVTRLGKEPQCITLAIATHLHAEHTGGIAELQRLTHCSAAVHRQAKRKKSVTRRSRFWLHGLTAAFRHPLSAWRHLQGIDGRFHIDQWLANGATLPGGWEVVYTPGHTPESISLYHPRQQILLAGDSLVGARGNLWVNPLNDDAEVLAMSLCTLAQLKVKVVYPAHGRPVRGQALFERALHRQNSTGAPQSRIRQRIPV